MVFAPPPDVPEKADAAPEPARSAAPVNPMVAQMAEAVAAALIARLAPWLDRYADRLARPAPPDEPPPIPLSADAARVYCGGLAKSTWADFDARGVIPGPVRVGGRVFWRRADLDLWAAKDCPGRGRFAALRAADPAPTPARN